MNSNDPSRCEGGHPEYDRCGLRDTCARFLQLGRDKTAEPATYVGTPVIRHCMGSSHQGQPPGYVRDEQGFQDVCNTWLAKQRKLGDRRTATLRQQQRGSR